MSESSKMKKVGKIKEAHGLRGEVYVLIFSKETSWVKNLKACGFKNSEKNVKRKLLVVRAKPYKEGLIVLFEGFENRNQSEEIIGSDFYVPADLFVSKKGEEIYLEEVLSFQIFDQESFVGVVSGFSSNGIQDLLLVDKEGFKNKIEIPFVKEFIKNINFEEKKIVMSLPEGLIEVNE